MQKVCTRGCAHSREHPRYGLASSLIVFVVVPCLFLGQCRVSQKVTVTCQTCTTGFRILGVQLFTAASVFSAYTQPTIGENRLSSHLSLLSRCFVKIIMYRHAPSVSKMPMLGEKSMSQSAWRRGRIHAHTWPRTEAAARQSNALLGAISNVGRLWDKEEVRAALLSLNTLPTEF